MIFVILFILIFLYKIIKFEHCYNETIYIDCFEIEGRIYRFNKFLYKKDYIRLRDEFVGNRPYKQCIKNYILQDYDVDVDTLVATKSKYYSDYCGVV